jgi:hypothetical protein
MSHCDQSYVIAIGLLYVSMRSELSYCVRPTYVSFRSELSYCDRPTVCLTVIIVRLLR